jgi:hypothetical protein
MIKMKKCSYKILKNQKKKLLTLNFRIKIIFFPKVKLKLMYHKYKMNFIKNKMIKLQLFEIVNNILSKKLTLKR